MNTRVILLKKLLELQKINGKAKLYDITGKQKTKGIYSLSLEKRNKRYQNPDLICKAK